MSFACHGAIQQTHPLRSLSVIENVWDALYFSLQSLLARLQALQRHGGARLSFIPTRPPSLAAAMATLCPAASIAFLLLMI